MSLAVSEKNEQVEQDDTAKLENQKVMLLGRVEKVSDDVANLSHETPMFNDNISVKQQAAQKEIVSDHESLVVPINPATLS